MATLQAGYAAKPIVVAMCTALTGNVNSDVIDRGAYRGPASVVIANTAGSTPTVTLNIKASVDGTNFYNVGYALVATPGTEVVTAITITTTATTTYLLPTDRQWRFLRLDFSANTNETITATYYQ